MTQAKACRGLQRTTGCSVMKAKYEAEDSSIEVWRSRSWVLGGFLS